MIQQPGQDEILVGVPSAGTLLDQHATLQRLFERLLARGIEQRRDGQTVVLWQVEGMDPLPTFDPRHVATIERLERRVIQVGEAARELGKVLATRIVPELEADADPSLESHDASTAALIRRYRTLRGRG